MTTNAILTQGTLIQRGDGGSPEIFTTIAEITNWDGPGGQAKVIPATHLQSTAIEKKMGLPDEGQFTFDVNFIPGDSTQRALRTDRQNKTLRNFRVVYTDIGLSQDNFSAYVLAFKTNGETDGVVKGSITLEISGPVAF